MSSIIQISDINKTYPNGHQALHQVNLDIQKGEIFALLGPNGAGKTTLISIICGLTNKTSGQVLIDGLDNGTHYRQTRQKIGLVPQEIYLGMFDRVWSDLKYSRGLFGKAPDDAYLHKLLDQLSLSDKKYNEIRSLSGGMKRRVLIAKALAHEPQILFLDEPTAGVDVELRKEMWELVCTLRQSGVTIILTTHYIEEAETIANRVGIINQGTVMLVENTATIMKELGKKQMQVRFDAPLEKIPTIFGPFNIELADDKRSLCYHFTKQSEYTNIPIILQALSECGAVIKEMHTSQSSLEEIFVNLVRHQ